jgi:AraC-like DNA-binding protein
MDWIQNITRAIHYIENHITDDICIDEISNHAYSSSSHFQFIFHMVAGMPIGEYIRNRRLSLAAQDLLKTNSKIIDVAMRYQYDTQESFSKAFTRFHGVPPSKIRQGKVRVFNPLSINITVKGGFDISRKMIDDFYWNDIDGEKDVKLTNAERYNRIVDWAGKARGQNPNVFDTLTEWELDDSEWNDEKIAENEQIFNAGCVCPV